MRSYKLSKILSVGDKYRNGKIIAIDYYDGGWLITIKYKTVPNRKYLVYW